MTTVTGHAMRIGGSAAESAGVPPVPGRQDTGAPKRRDDHPGATGRGGDRLLRGQNRRLESALFCC